MARLNFLIAAILIFEIGIDVCRVLQDECDCAVDFASDPMEG